MLVNSSDKNTICPQYLSSPVKQLNSKRTVSCVTDVFFKSGQDKNTKDKKYQNPINSGFEYLDAAKLTALAGLGVAGKVLWDTVIYGDIPTKKDVKGLVLLSLAIGAGSALLSLPKNLYKRKVETFQRKKEMDVYVRTNSAEQGLYEKIDTEAQKADEKQKKELTQSYLKLGTRKNQLPEFIKEYQK
ncbi:MAG: hypothetical protein PHC34_13500 [Candidatus Gastranaerophilales bacterium]|nr:hypothetical protein [Candidatus Gastranaerophilales bacterium]